MGPLRAFGIGESIAGIRQGWKPLRAGGRGSGGSSVRLDREGAFDLRATAYLQGLQSDAFEETLASRRRETARNAWISLGLGILCFVGWLYRLVTMRWTANATLTELQFVPACAVFFLLAFKFGLQNFQIRMRRRATATEYLLAASRPASAKEAGRRRTKRRSLCVCRRRTPDQNVPGGRNCDPPPAPDAHCAPS
jgi:hypothetical protein